MPRKRFRVTVKAVDASNAESDVGELIVDAKDRDDATRKRSSRSSGPQSSRRPARSPRRTPPASPARAGEHHGARRLELTASGPLRNVSPRCPPRAVISTPSKTFLSEDERAVRDTVRRFVDDEFLPLVRKHFADATFPTELTPRIAELGCFGPTVPTEYGGAG